MHIILANASGLYLQMRKAFRGNINTMIGVSGRRVLIRSEYNAAGENIHFQEFPNEREFQLKFIGSDDIKASFQNTIDLVGKMPHGATYDYIRCYINQRTELATIDIGLTGIDV